MQPYETIKRRYPDGKVPYFELLRTKEWSDRREEIIDRDGCMCSMCQKRATSNFYDSNSKENIYLWYGEEKVATVTNTEGKTIYSEAYIPIDQADKPYSLHVHHRLYVLERLPWEYDNSELITLCNWCHWKTHEETVIPVYRWENDRLQEIEVHACLRCHGAGVFPEFAHVEQGICFRCRGALYEEFIL